MGRSLSPLLRQELANLDKDADSRRSAMKALRSYARNLDTKSIPHFLAEVSDGGASAPAAASFSGECTISLFEVLARVHGRNIVPQIDNIMSTILRTLSSSGGSFPLHQACSKVVPAIARYGIDPATPDDEKSRIIGSLCKPLSDALMGSSETAAASAAPGAALCLKALVESTNWRFAPDEMVNEVCLKVAGALEEKATQSNAHMGLVMALAKHNSLIAEAYARSLVRSGLQILVVGGGESNSQKRLSAVQMINFLMKCVDPRSISSELFRIVDVMEKCQVEDKMPFVRGAALEALQTAKTLTGQKGSRHETSSCPTTNSSFGRRDEKTTRREGDKKIGAIGNSSSAAEFCSPESQTVDSCIKYDAFADSPASIGQSSCNYEYRRRANRRLWNNDGIVDISLKDGLFLNACSGKDNSKLDFEQNFDHDQIDANKEHSSAFSGFRLPNATESSPGNTTPSPQITRPQLTIDDVKIYSTPRKLIRSLQSSTTGHDSGLSPKRQHDCLFTRETSHEVDSSSTVTQSHNLSYKPQGRSYSENMITMGKLNVFEDAGFVQDGAESVSSTEVAENNTCELLCQADVEHKSGVTVNSKASGGNDTAGLRFFCAISLILLAIVWSLMRDYDDELVEFYMVPT